MHCILVACVPETEKLPKQTTYDEVQFLASKSICRRSRSEIFVTAIFRKIEE